MLSAIGGFSPQQTYTPDAVLPEQDSAAKTMPALPVPALQANQPAGSLTQDHEQYGQEHGQRQQTPDRNAANLAPFSHQRHQALQGYLKLNQGQQAFTQRASENQEELIPAGTENSTQGSSGLEPATALNPEATVSEKEKSDRGQDKNDMGSDGKEMTDEEQRKTDQMEARHQEVKVHEQAHKSAGGSLASAPSYSYETGPDGKRYITDGEVQIDTSKEKDPRKTIEKMQQVKRAALAPAQPSSQDRRVASEASQIEAQARSELAAQNREESTGGMTNKPQEDSDTSSIKTSGQGRSGKPDTGSGISAATHEPAAKLSTVRP